MKKVIKKCPVCEIEFAVPKCHQERYKTCGRQCGAILRTKPIVHNICKKCHIKFVSKRNPKQPQIYCSKPCAASDRYTRIIKTCKECKKTFPIAPHRLKAGTKRGSYCSRECQLKHWGSKSLKAQYAGCYRRNAWRVYEKKCYDCGITDMRVIVIHHIDGDRKNGKVKNLIPVCHNCHCLRHIVLNGKKQVFSYKGTD